MRSKVGLPVLVVAFIVPGARTVAQVPVAVSPGDVSKVVLIGDPCPTFSWDAVEGAAAHELVVYGVGKQDQEAEPVLKQEIPGSASSWTPPLESCLDRGRQYAWSMRAIGKKTFADWSAPSLFEVASGPSRMELEEALAVVRQYLNGVSGEGGAPVALRQTEGAGTVVQVDGATMEGGSTPSSAGNTEAFGVAELTVEGEVRTVAADDTPRTWGRGRPGSRIYGVFGALCEANGIRYGLSLMQVPWYAAAEACPAGTWVCDILETAPCDTLRPDTAEDGEDCDRVPLDLPSHNHWGWLADSTGSNRGQGRGEADFAFTFEVCYQLPVWCCTK